MIKPSSLFGGLIFLCCSLIGINVKLVRFVLKIKKHSLFHWHKYLNNRNITPAVGQIIIL